jgi:hypothetical protein
MGSVMCACRKPFNYPTFFGWLDPLGDRWALVDLTLVIMDRRAWLEILFMNSRGEYDVQLNLF